MRRGRPGDGDCALRFHLRTGLIRQALTAAADPLPVHYLDELDVEEVRNVIKDLREQIRAAFAARGWRVGLAEVILNNRRG